MDELKDDAGRDLMSRWYEGGRSDIVVGLFIGSLSGVNSPQ